MWLLIATGLLGTYGWHIVTNHRNDAARHRQERAVAEVVLRNYGPVIGDVYVDAGSKDAYFTTNQDGQQLICDADYWYQTSQPEQPIVTINGVSCIPLSPEAGSQAP